MVEAPSIGELCHHARNACVMAGLTPVAWRWSIGAHLLFTAEIAPFMVAYGPQEIPPPMPPGCLGIYNGLPVYHMGCPPAFAHPAVACIGARESPAF